MNSSSNSSKSCAVQMRDEDEHENGGDDLQVETSSSSSSVEGEIVGEEEEEKKSCNDDDTLHIKQQPQSQAPITVPVIPPPALASSSSPSRLKLRRKKATTMIIGDDIVMNKNSDSAAAAAMDNTRTVNQRLVEYFCIITSQPRHRRRRQRRKPTNPPSCCDTESANTSSTSQPTNITACDSPSRRASTPANWNGSPSRRASLPNTSISSHGTVPTLRKHDASPIRKKQLQRDADIFSSTSNITDTNSAGSVPEGQAESRTDESCWTGGNIHMPQQHDDYSNCSPNSAAEDEEEKTYNTTTTRQTVRTFSPVITARYPATDYADNPLNPMILHFCYPTAAGDMVVTATPHYAMPRVHHFVLTLGCGRKLYGTCLTVLEECYHDNNNDDEECERSVVVQAASRDDGIELLKRKTATDSDDDRSNSSRKSTVLYVPKVLCLLSTWPYLTAFREYLSQLYRLAVTTNVMTAPLERYVVNLCCEIPAPPPGAYEIQLPILDSIIRFWAPPAKLPIAYTALPYHTLFECLDIDNVLTVWTALMLERKVLLLSSQSSALTVCAEILCSLLFPLRWSHLYVPMLPRLLCPILDAPVPYLCGTVRENYMHHARPVIVGHDENDPGGGGGAGVVRDATAVVLVVDLDRNTVEFLGGGRGGGANTTTSATTHNNNNNDDDNPLPTLPAKKRNKLRAALTAAAGDVFWKARGMEEAYAKELHKKVHKRSNLENLRLLLAASSSAAGATDSGCPQWDEKLSTLDHAFNLAYTPESPNLVDPAAASHDEQSQWDRVQEAFMRFFVALLKDYRKHLIVPKTPITNNTRPSFDQIAFLAGLKGEHVAFVSELCMTQQFDDFLSRRMYSPGEPDLVFFDQSIDAKLNRSKLKLKKVETPFLHAAKVHKELTKLHAVPPNEEGLPFNRSARKMPYIYEKLPDTFDKSLFCTPRPIPKMISAEFDRQAILVSKLRANILAEHEDNELFDGGDLMEFCGGDYDPSPEVASFTVFLFVYSSLVGQDWKKYSQKRREEDAKKPPIERGAEKRESAATETVDLEAEAIDSFLQDVSLGCCGVCSENGVMVITSTLSYIGASAEDAYNSYFRKPDNYDNLSLHEDKNVSFPETDAAAEEYEEAREVAAAQLEVAFETLATMTLRGLSVDSDAYLSLMEACGRCGDTKRARKLMELMRKDGCVTDSEVLSCFISAFAHTEVRGKESAADTPVTNTEKVEGDAYCRFLEKGLDTAKGEKCSRSMWFHSSVALPLSPPVTSPVPLDDDSDEGSDLSSAKSSAGSSTLADWMHLHPSRQKKKKKRKRKMRKSTVVDTPVTEMISRHLSLGESLLDFVYPDLVIDTNSDSCPHCSNNLAENDVIDGWKPCAFQDYTTKCPECQHRFVPRFVVTCTAPDFEGSQGSQTPLYCEFLSPWVLRKEFQHIIKGGGDDSGIDKIINPTWRSGTDIRATLFWNLVVCCRRYRLPFTFLLQGNFQNRLILPRKPDEI